MIGEGMEVYFRSKVFEGPYAPYYDAYQGHKFRVVKIHHGNHLELECLTDPELRVAGWVHDDEVKRA